MAMCKDCLYYEHCFSRINFADMEYDHSGKPIKDMDERCPSFKAKSRFVELPCKINDVVYGLVKYKGGMKVRKGIVNEIYFTKKMELVIVMYHLIRGKWEKDIFPTEEAAETALKALKGGAGNG